MKKCRKVVCDSASWDSKTHRISAAMVVLVEKKPLVDVQQNWSKVDGYDIL